MSPIKFQSIRKALGLDRGQMAFALGYEGANGNDQVHRLETGKRPIRPEQLRLIEAYRAGYRPPDWESNGYAEQIATLEDGADAVSTNEMTPEQARAARIKLKLNLAQMGYMLGFEGKSVKASMHNLESGQRRVRPAQARLIRAYLSGYRPRDWGAYPPDQDQDDEGD